MEDFSAKDNNNSARSLDGIDFIFPSRGICSVACTAEKREDASSVSHGASAAAPRLSGRRVPAVVRESAARELEENRRMIRRRESAEDVKILS